MTTIEDITGVLNKMILSASGWRGIFANNGEEESNTEKISEAHRVISGAAARIFAEYLLTLKPDAGSRGENGKPIILLGIDTRPTGKAIIESMIPVLLDLGCDVQYAGVIAAPEIMAWARAKNFYHEPHKPTQTIGFIYISASHNPIGHNGIKFGLTDGGVLAADESNILIENFKSFLEIKENIKKIELVLNSAPLRLCESSSLNTVSPHLCESSSLKTVAFNAYFDFCAEVVWNGSSAIETAFKDGLKKYPLSIVCDFNGSARAASIDKEYFNSFGFNFKSINDEPGQIVHRIVPEGESLDPCRALLEEAHAQDASFLLGYVPDCDGDRGNLVVWDDAAGKARVLEAQEVFALCCAAELSHLVWTDGTLVNEQFARNKERLAAVAINDPTSMRVDRIAEAFGVSVFRAEVGEANVVSLARKLRGEGYIVRILGEGSAGGNITHPSAVRDPIHTVMAIAKMLAVRTADGKQGLFEIWRNASGQKEKYREDFSISDIIASLPQFITTPAYSKDAVMRIKTQEHALLKDRYQQIFLRDWKLREIELRKQFGIFAWEAIAYNGITETRSLRRFGDAGKGGLKILFTGNDGGEIAYIWMRGSATEPVFRIMADAQTASARCIESISLSSPAERMRVYDSNNQSERYLLEWQKQMIMEADNS